MIIKWKRLNLDHPSWQEYTDTELLNFYLTAKKYDMFQDEIYIGNDLFLQDGDIQFVTELGWDKNIWTRIGTTKKDKELYKKFMKLKKL